MAKLYIVFLSILGFSVLFAESRSEYPEFCEYVKKCTRLHAEMSKIDSQLRSDKGDLGSDDVRSLGVRLGEISSQYTACNLDVIELLGRSSQQKCAEIQEYCGRNFFHDVRKILEGVHFDVVVTEPKK